MGVLYQLPGDAEQSAKYQQAAAATAKLIDWYYTVTAPSLSETNLKEAEQMLREFDELKNVFIPYNASSLNLPKMHALTKYTVAIRENGCMENYTTEHSERQHITDLKSLWRTSNKVNYLPQIVEGINIR